MPLSSQHLLNPFEPLNRTYRTPHVLYFGGHSSRHVRRPVTRSSAPVLPAFHEEQRWRILYQARASQLPRDPVSGWLSGSRWGLRELQCLRVLPELNRSARQVLGDIHARDGPKLGAFKILTCSINSWENANERGRLQDVPSAQQVRALQQAGHPFALFYSRMRQMHVSRTGGGQHSSLARGSQRWDQLQAEIRPDALLSLRAASEPPQTPPHPRKRATIWDQHSAVSSPSVRVQSGPANPFRRKTTIQVPPMTETLATDEAYTWALLDTFLSAMLVILHQHGWSTLFHADDASAQFSFDCQPKQQTFQLHFGAVHCTAQSDGGLCLTDDTTAAVDLAHPLAVVECKRKHSSVNRESLFAQVVAEMLGAAQNHRHLGTATLGYQMYILMDQMHGLSLDGLKLSFLRADFTHDYLDCLTAGTTFPDDFHGVAVSETAGASLNERRGREAAVDGFLRLIYALRRRTFTARRSGWGLST